MKSGFSLASPPVQKLICCSVVFTICNEGGATPSFNLADAQAVLTAAGITSPNGNPAPVITYIESGVVAVGNDATNHVTGNEIASTGGDVEHIADTFTNTINAVESQSTGGPAVDNNKDGIPDKTAAADWELTNIPEDTCVKIAIQYA